PTSSPYVFIYYQEINNSIEIFDHLFDYLDYDYNIIESIKHNWIIRKNI
ncbi:unnamed protein product, partial [Rotaria sordida]